MAELSGTNLAGSIVPFTTEDKFATHLAKFGKGGWRSVADTAERDEITADRREAGMAVYVVAEKKLYILADDLTSWTELDTDSGYTKDEIDGLLAAIEAQIDANADAIQKTREDFIAADSEIYTILNAQATELATHRNDIDGLGDQVSAIESKIPENASAENPLVTRSEISSVYKFKGSVATYNDLPTGATVGDVYNVTDTGANYAWDGSAWDKLSETVDLSSYATTAYVNAREQDIRDDYIQADSELQQQINAHAEQITTNKNDIDNLGDQVAEIEAKIPESASETNQLVTQTDLTNKKIEIMGEVNESVSELQTQITAQAAAIADKVDKAGDTMTGTLNVPELNVATEEGTINLSITAGTATIATNNGLDIVAPTKFDTAPTTDDTTAWADVNATALVTKQQVTTALASSGGGSAEYPDQTNNAGKFLMTDGANVSWQPTIRNNTDITNALAIGSDATANGENAVVIGSNALSNSPQGANVVIGPNAAAAKRYAVAIGHNATATGEESVQLGQGENTQDLTLQFREYTLVKQDGTIPPERLSPEPPAEGFTLVYDGQAGELRWAKSGGGSETAGTEVIIRRWN